MTLQLVVLAAGLGSRYGGLKQMEGVGPGGATLMEYSLYDARRAGFDEAVFVIRPDMAEAFDAYAGRFAGRVPWRTALQRNEDIPTGAAVAPNRTKPWGTAHAVLAARPLMTGPFAVLNADDYYGPEAFVSLAEFLGRHQGDQPPQYAIVGYRLRDTVSPAGGVSRAACRIDAARWLEAIAEVSALARAEGDTFAGVGESGPVRLPGDTIVSMNLWGFTPSVFETLQTGWVEFFRSADLEREEYLLPTVIQAALGRGACRVRVLDPGSRWFGITHQADRAAVAAALSSLVAVGRYPERLWA